MLLNDSSNQALTRIDNARKDVATILALIKKQEDGDANFKDLTKQATDMKEGLDGLEQQFRTPPETKGIVFSGDKVSSKVNMAGYYVGSSSYAPSPTAEVYVAHARASLQTSLETLNEYMADEVASLKQAVDDAGIGLLEAAEPVDMPD